MKLWQVTGVAGNKHVRSEHATADIAFEEAARWRHRGIREVRVTPLRRTDERRAA